MVVDVLAVTGCVTGALAFLGWRLGGRPSTPSCHRPPNGAPSARARKDNAAADVVVGASLARGLERARARTSSTTLSRPGQK